MGTPSMGAQAKLAMDPSVTSISDFDASSEQYEFISENLRMVQEHINTHGQRGSRSRVGDRTRIGSERMTGTIVLTPTPVELDLLLPRILGAAESTDTFDLAETLPEFGVLVDRIANRFVYTGCRVAKATFSIQKGAAVRLSLDIEGETETVTGTTFPATVPAIDSGQPYVISDLTFSLSADASAAEVEEVEIVIDNMLDTERFMNSVTRTQIPAMDRLITVRMTVPYTADETGLYDQAVAGAAGTITLTNGGQSTLFTFANLKVPAESPVVPNKSEIKMTLNMVAYKSGSDNELVVTHDSAA